jgi:hypothetical protein
VARRIRLEVDGVQAVAELHDELSPKTAEAFWQSLPIESALLPAKWSGQACFFHPGSAPMKEVTELENPVCSIYPGTLVARPRGSEALIAYGPSEYRWGIGTDYVTRVAKVVENRAALLRVLARTHDEGEKRIKVNREDQT